MGFILALGILAFLIMVHPFIFGLLVVMLALPFVVAVILHIKGIEIPSSISQHSRRRRRSYRGRKSKSFLTMMLEGQARTQKRNGSHRGVMCGPGGSRKKR